MYHATERGVRDLRSMTAARDDTLSYTNNTSVPVFGDYVGLLLSNIGQLRPPESVVATYARAV